MNEFMLLSDKNEKKFLYDEQGDVIKIKNVDTREYKYNTFKCQNEHVSDMEKHGWRLQRSWMVKIGGSDLEPIYKFKAVFIREYDYK